MIKKRTLLNVSLIFVVITSGLFILSFNLIPLNPITSPNQDYMNTIKSAVIGEPLSLDDISINRSSIYQHFETVNIQVNVSKYDPHENHTEVHLSDLYGNTEVYNMTRVSDDKFSFNYTTSLSPTPQLLGFIHVTFLVYNVSRYVLNDPSTCINFTIKPNVMVMFLPDSTYYKGELLFATLTPDYNSKILYSWDSWNVSIGDDSFMPLFNISGYNHGDISFPINNSFNLNKDYYVHVNLINSSDEIFTISYFNFKVENKNPEIIISTIILDSYSILRSGQNNCQIKLNASDLETTNYAFINISMDLEHSLDDIIHLGLLENNGDGSFQLDFHVAYSNPIGNYSIILTVKDNDGGVSLYTHTTPLEVRNNPPIIHSYKINGLSLTQGIKIYYSHSITFSFNVTDVEGSIASITVVLIGPNNQMIERIVSSDQTVYFSSYELITGTWYVYVYAEDSDGAVVSLTDDYGLAPQAITIIPDLLSAVLPWIALVIGLIIGALVCGGMGYYWIKKRILEGEQLVPKKKIQSQEKGISEKNKARNLSKPSELSDEKIEGIKTEQKEKKPENDKVTPQRKIKRKL